MVRELKVFMTHKLSNGDNITIYHLTGWHLMKATIHCAGEPQRIFFELVLYSTYVNGKEMTLEYFENLPIDDSILLIQQVGLQTEKLKM